MMTMVVTGGTRGIGRSISLKLAQSGAQVLALYARNRKMAEALESEAKELGLNIKTIRGDLTKADKYTEVLDAIKESTDEITGLVHAAASGVHKEAKDLTEKHLKWTFDVNVFSFHNLVRDLLPLLKHGSRLVGITSHGGQNVIPHYSAVGASKGALESLCRHYAQEFAPLGISVNCVCPGMVLTDAVDAFPDKEDRISHTIKGTPSGSMTTPEDVADLVDFLIYSPGAKQIVGQTLVIDGGKGLRA